MKKKEKNFVPKFLAQEEVAEFVKRLIFTINWVAKLIQGHNFQGKANDQVLRQTNPIIHGQPLFIFDHSSKETDLTFELYRTMDFQIAFEAALNLREKDMEINFQNIESKGRIFCFDAGLTTHDGAPVAESYGFVDTL